MFGRQTRIPVDLIFQLPQGQPQYHNQYVTKLQQTMWEAYERVREKMGHHLKRQKEIYDKKAHTTKVIKYGYLMLLSRKVHLGNFINLGQDLTW